MLTRIITALILAPIVIGITFYLPTDQFSLVLAGVCMLGLYEWNKLTVNSLFAFLGGVLLVLIIAWFATLAATGLRFLCFVLSIYWVYLFIDLRKNGLTIRWSPLSGYIEGLILLLGFWAGMILLHNISALHMIAAMVVIWAADSFAYFAGKSYGRTPLAAKISPKKTIEGLTGGLVGAAVIIFAFAFWGFDFQPQESLFWLWFLAGILAALISVVGDLFQSRIKRSAKVKDSGSLLPGHGGILDRIDGLIAAMPVFATILTLVLY